MDGSFKFVQLIGIDAATFAGAPKQITQGRLDDLRLPNTVILDEYGAQKLSRDPANPISLGEVFEINDHEARVVGICKSRMSFSGNPYLFTTYDQAVQYAPSTRKMLSSVLAGAQLGENPSTDARTAQLSVWPFLAPAFNHKHLSSLNTRLDPNGICRQSTDYTCGPAAAVTALRKLGFPAEEGEIAILAHTTSAIGTPPDILARALHQRYGSKGLSEFHVFGSVDELSHSGFTLAVMKYRPWVDHYVAVLEATNNHVVLGDPLLGFRTLSRQEFARTWRFQWSSLQHSKNSIRATCPKQDPQA